jgi:ubiquitin-like 1-activating enzyme E1 A
MTTTTTTTDKDLVYDRQVRLWGAAAQQRLSSSKVLITGKLGMLASECIKNLVLAGINLTLHDPSPIPQNRTAIVNNDINLFLRYNEEDHKFINIGEACVPRVKDMNPLADIVAISEIKDVQQFALVVGIDLDLNVAQQLEEQCCSGNIPFMMAASSEMLGYVILSLGPSWNFNIDKKIDDVITTSMETIHYPRLLEILDTSSFTNMNVTGRVKMPLTFFALCVLKTMGKKDNLPSTKRIRVQDQEEEEEQQQPTINITDEQIRSILLHSTNSRRGKPKMSETDEHAFIQEVKRVCMELTSNKPFAPSCTILGGLIGNEAIKIVSGKDAPTNNILFFDGKDGSAIIRRVSGG